MANIPIKNASGATEYLKAGGAGSSGDPYIPEQTLSAIVPGTSATSLGKAEDAAHTSGDVGVMFLGVANATHTTALSGTDGDYTPIAVDTTGKVGIRGTFAEDAAHTSADLGVFVLAVRADTAAVTSGTDGDYSAFVVDASGRLHVNVGAFTPGTAAGSLGKAEDAAHSSGDTGVMSLAVRADAPANLSGTDGDYEPISVSGGRQWVSNVPATIITVAPTVDTNIYASGDLVGGKLTLANAARIAAGGGKIVSVTLVDQAKQSLALDVLFFEADPSGTTFTDNAALDVADADLLNAVGAVSIVAGDYIALADNSLATVKNVGLRFKLDSGTSLYACLIARSTPTYVAGTDVQLKVAIEQD